MTKTTNLIADAMGPTTLLVSKLTHIQRKKILKELHKRNITEPIIQTKEIININESIGVNMLDTFACFLKDMDVQIEALWMTTDVVPEDNV